MNTKVWLLGLLCVIPACKSYPPLTKSLREEFATDLANLQLYTSQGVELTRELRSEERAVSEHTIRIEKGKSIEVVKFPRHTPGILAKSGDDESELHVRFEDDPDGTRALVFRLETVSRIGEVYRLHPNGDDGAVVYDGKEYQPSHRPHLRVDLRQSEQVEKDSRKVPGVRLKKN